MADPGAEISDSEDVFRRVPQHWIDAGTGVIDIQAFIPTKADGDGLSIDLASMTDAEAVATRSGTDRLYHVIRLNVGALRQLQPTLQLRVFAKPVSGNPAHCIIPALSRTQYDKSKENKLALKGLANSIVAELQRPGNTLGRIERFAADASGL